ncbi:WD40 repeat-like protein [Suillus brevipes Sb2]|nr:WD40 repeat-like protein [Suillus brevipes Sb2]
MSAKQREGLPSDSSRSVAPRKSEKYPPRYGAQHRQDALWEGGNEAPPPGWREIRSEGDGQPLYHWDDVVFMSTEHRPLPGVRLDYPWQLIPGCEWHISPFGRSYFVNHNTRTTSWKKPRPKRPAGSLMPECIIKRDSPWYNENLACLGTSGDILSISDGAICQWTRAGKPAKKPFDIKGGAVGIMSVSPDGLMVVGACGDGTVRLWNIQEGSLVGHPWEGNNDRLRCLDWSPNGAEIAGGSKDGTIRRWNTTTGRQIGPLIKGSDKRVLAIKYSPQGDKFASGGSDGIIHVWSKDGKLLIEIKGHDKWVTSMCWSKDGKNIFSGSADHTIRTWQSIDGKELVVIRGHTNPVRSLCLSPDESHLVSASDDYSVRIWDLETNQQVGDPLWHDDQVNVVVMSSDGQYFTSGISGPHAKIYVWSLEAALERARGLGDDTAFNTKLEGRAAPARDISLAPRQQSNNRGLARYGNDFWGDDTNRTPRHSADTSSSPRLRDFFGSLRSSTRSANAPPSVPFEPRRLNFSLFPVKFTRHPVDVAPCREEDVSRLSSLPFVISLK